MYALWGIGLLMLAKAIVVVDHDVDVHNLSEVAWRVTANIDPRQDILLVDGPVDAVVVWAQRRDDVDALISSAPASTDAKAISSSCTPLQKARRWVSRP